MWELECCISSWLFGRRRRTNNSKEGSVNPTPQLGTFKNGIGQEATSAQPFPERTKISLPSSILPHLTRKKTLPLPSIPFPSPQIIGGVGGGSLVEAWAESWGGIWKSCILTIFPPFLDEGFDKAFKIVFRENKKK